MDPEIEKRHNRVAKIDRRLETINRTILRAYAIVAHLDAERAELYEEWFSLLGIEPIGPAPEHE